MANRKRPKPARDPFSTPAGVAFVIFGYDRANMYAYRSGWYAGRADMLSAYSEALDRGLSSAEWVRAMVEVDLARMQDRSFGR